MRTISTTSPEAIMVKLHFNGPVHFGKGRIESVRNSFSADTFFSAFVQQVIKLEGGHELVEKMVQEIKEGSLAFSDAYPFIGDTNYFPKPMIRIESDNRGESSIKKAYKKLEFISTDAFQNYLSGSLDPLEEGKKISNLGFYSGYDKVWINEGDENNLYRVGTFHFKPGNGLYILISCSNDHLLNTIIDIISDLGIVGIGGKRNSGMGSFTEEVVPFRMPYQLTGSGAQSSRWMMLSVGFPRTDEISEDMSNAEYRIIKRTGFVQSSTYADRALRKIDFYCFSSGSCFQKPFKGDVYDVGVSGRHPVYRYASPLWLEVT